MLRAPAGPVVVAWRPVLAVAGLVAVALGVTSAAYGWFGDEMYFLSAGARPAAGYADQPPLLPLVAAGLDALAPGSLVVMRLPATLLTAGGVVIAALIAAELGGGRRAQILAAAATAICPYLLSTGHLLATSTLDPFLWSVVLLLVVRWIRLEREGRPRDRLLLGVGLVTAVALADKVLIPVLLIGLALGVAVAGPRRLLTRPLLWVGMALAAVSTVPTLLWQAANGWPQARMGEVVAGEAGLFGDRWQFVPRALYYAGLLPGAVLVVVGLGALLFREALRPWRSVGIAVVVGTVLLLVPGGRPYYVSGFYALLFAAGAVVAEAGTAEAGTAGARPSLVTARRAGRSRWRWTVGPTSVVVSAVLTALWVLPLGPSAWRAPADFEVQGQLGWPEMADAVAAQWAALPPEERERSAIVAWSYWYAAALEHEGPSRGLPPTVHSTHRGFGYFAPPPDSATTVLLVGPVPWAARCAVLRPLPTYVAPLVSPTNQQVPMGLCTLGTPWSVAWPSLRNLA